MTIREGVFNFVTQAPFVLNNDPVIFTIGWPGGRGRIVFNGTDGASAVGSLFITPEFAVGGGSYNSWAPIAPISKNVVEFFEAPRGILNFTIQNSGSSPALNLTQVDIQPAE